MPVIKYDHPEEFIVKVSEFVRHTFPRTTMVINGRRVLWPECNRDTLTVEVNNLPGAGMQRVLAQGIKFCIEALDNEESAGKHTHLPVKEVKFKPRHIEVILNRSKVGKDNFQ